MSVHEPVMLQEVMDLLSVQPGSDYIDATLGGGGYTEEILQRSAPDGRVLALDLNEEALEDVRGRFGPRSTIYNPPHRRIRESSSYAKASEDARKPSLDRSRSESAPEGGKDDPASTAGGARRLLLVHGNFRHIEDIARLHQFQGVAGVTFDLGLSSDLLERSAGGFSFQGDEPLIMRYDYTGGENVNAKLRNKRENRENVLTAADVVNEYSVAELTRVFKEYGEIRQAERLATQIRAHRKKSRINTTADLRGVVETAVKSTTPKLLAQVWQALRIEVNGELESLERGLTEAWNVLAGGGVIVIVSFHSLEDRIAKHFIRAKEKAGKGTALTDGPLRPTRKEVEKNPRARSAKVRAVKKSEY